MSAFQISQQVFTTLSESHLSTGRLARRQSQAPAAETTEAEPQVPASSQRLPKLHSVYEPAVPKEWHSKNTDSHTCSISHIFRK